MDYIFLVSKYLYCFDLLISSPNSLPFKLSRWQVRKLTPVHRLTLARSSASCSFSFDWLAFLSPICTDLMRSWSVNLAPTNTWFGAETAAQATAGIDPCHVLRAARLRRRRRMAVRNGRSQRWSASAWVVGGWAAITATIPPAARHWRRCRGGTFELTRCIDPCQWASLGFEAETCSQFFVP